MIINIVKDQSKEEEEEIEMGVTFHMVPTVACLKFERNYIQFIMEILPDGPQGHIFE